MPMPGIACTYSNLLWARRRTSTDNEALPPGAAVRVRNKARSQAAYAIWSLLGHGGTSPGARVIQLSFLAKFRGFKVPAGAERQTAIICATGSKSDSASPNRPGHDSLLGRIRERRSGCETIAAACVTALRDPVVRVVLPPSTRIRQRLIRSLDLLKLFLGTLCVCSLGGRRVCVTLSPHFCLNTSRSHQFWRCSFGSSENPPCTCRDET